jgi:hypothetical protein
MFDILKSELTRRTLLYKAGFGFMALGITGAVGTILRPVQTLAQAGAAPAKEPPLPPDLTRSTQNLPF